ncbi:MAG: GAF domain-containing protein, partial [Deltaproteobacteria bacterium]|nr:GAF domain-containing protein [Deltaproteobacteria bacterium]
HDELRLIRNGSGEPVEIVGSWVDVSERRHAEERLRYVTRLYAFLGQVNQAIVRLQDRGELFEGLARVAVESGGFRMASVGLVDEATGVVSPVACAGHEDGYLSGLSIHCGADPVGLGPTGSALRNGAVAICDDIASDPRMRPWRDAALRRGYGSSAAIPFRLRGQVTGTLNLYAAEPGFFAEEERRLLEEVGVDISFALDAMETERERMQAEQALKESEQNYRTLFDSATDAIFLLDLDGNFIDVNETAHERLGYTKEEMVSLHISRLDPPEFAARVPERLAQIARQGETVFESAHVRKDGSVMPVEVSARLVEFRGRRAYLSVVRDITERKRAEEDLRHRTRGLATLLDVSQSMAATLDMAKVIQATADGATRLFGLDTAAVYLLEGEALHLRATAPALPPGFPEELCRSNLADHPHIREALASRRPLSVPDLAAVELTPAEQEVTRRRNLRSILYLPLLAGDGPEGVLIVASNGEPRNFTEAQIDQCSTLANLAALAVANARLYEAGRKHAAELEKQVTERRRAEEEKEGLQTQLAHAQKMEAVGRLAGGVAHDFNNMLAVILGRAELALRRAGPESPLHQDLTEILEAAEHSSVLTRQLLAFARRQTVNPRVFDLNEAVAGMLQILRRLIGEDIDLVWMPGAGTLNVRLDPSQLDQLLANLVVNARDAIAGTGRVTLETRNVTLAEAGGASGEALAPGEYVLLTVSDNGCGMDDETLGHLFEPFFTTKGPGQGTGLGLATVYGIVRQNGGVVDAASAPGQGSTFRVYLPRARPEDRGKTEGRAGGVPPGGTETVLLVEDEEAILTLCTEMLEGLGYTVLRAGTPGEALRLAEEYVGTIHLLVTDVVMPEMNGRALSEGLTAARPDLRCLFLSGYTADVIAHRGVLEEGVRLLEKPFTLRQLAEKVREVLE